MPAFSVVILATGIDLPSVDDPIIGFYASRRIKAKTADHAADEAKALILKEWSEGNYQARNRASRPWLEIDSIWQVPWYKTLFTKAPKRGFTFFTVHEMDA